MNWFAVVGCALMLLSAAIVVGLVVFLLGLA